MSSYKLAGPVIQNIDIRQVTTGTTAIADGTLYLTTIDLPMGFTVSTIYWLSGTTALVNGGGSPHYWTGLFDKSRVNRGQSADNTSKTIGQSSLISDAMSAPFTTTYAGQHYIGIMVASAGGTQPTMTTLASLSAIMGLTSVDGGKFNGTSTTGNTGTAPSTAAAITQTGPIPWVGVA